MSVFIISTDGSVRHIYSDKLISLDEELGVVTVRRASDVEPCWKGGWIASMQRVGGPVLGPFWTRANALAAETSWLERHNIPEVKP